MIYDYLIDRCHRLRAAQVRHVENGMMLVEMGAVNMISCLLYSSSFASSLAWPTTALAERVTVPSRA